MVVIIWGKYGKNPSRTENITEQTRFSKSRSNDLEDIGEGQRSSHATHLLMLVIICTKYGKNPSGTVDATERTRFSRPRPNDLEDIGQGQRSLYATHPLKLVINANVRWVYYGSFYQFLHQQLFHFCKSICEILWITFIFYRCHWRWVTLTPVKYYIICNKYFFDNSKNWGNSRMEEISLVTPPLISWVYEVSFQWIYLIDQYRYWTQYKRSKPNLSSYYELIKIHLISHPYRWALGHLFCVL